MSNILEVKDLNMQYKTSEGFVKAIQDVSFDIPEDNLSVFPLKS